MEAMIARCLDSDPDKRPSARELVDFMLQLPQQLSLEGTASCSDWSSRESPLHQQLLALNPTHGVALPILMSRPLDSKLLRGLIGLIAADVPGGHCPAAPTGPPVSPCPPHAHGRVRAGSEHVPITALQILSVCPAAECLSPWQNVGPK